MNSMQAHHIAEPQYREQCQIRPRAVLHWLPSQSRPNLFSGD